MNSNDLKIISKKYKFDQLNQKIKNKLLTIDDYVEIKNNDYYTYIFLCEIEFDKNVLNNISVNKKINLLVSRIEKDFMKKFSKEYNLYTFNDNLIAITIGDINGVGLEIILKLWEKNNYRKFVIFSNYSLLEKKIKNYNSRIKINIVNNNKNKLVFNKFKINVFNYDAKSNVINTYLSLKFAHKLCLEKKFIGIITLH